MAGDRSSQRRANKLTPAELAAVACPVERARKVCQVARRKGTLSSGLAAVRRQAIVEALDKSGPDPFTVLELAAELDLTSERIYQIVKEQARADLGRTEPVASHA